ncbi:MAG: hypothetical protein JW797_20470 [Bradymonadales bacterium]|nr:hypothetical protein [Bradymonadales bacterium]
MLSWIKWVPLFLLLFALSCTESLDALDSESVSPAAAPLLGAADGRDAADHQCQIVLVDLARQSNDMGGYVTTDDSRNWIWFGRIDVAHQVLSQGAKPAILYRNTWEDSWYEVPATVTDGSPTGFVRYQFQLSKNLPQPGMSGTSLTRASFEVVPVLHQANGGRLFDHNRNPGDFDNYLLTVNSGWSIQNDDNLCSVRNGSGNTDLPGVDSRPEAVLTFTADGRILQGGRLVAGGTLQIDYELDRLNQCRGTHNGYPAWNIWAYVKFTPGDQIHEASVRAFESYYGTPTNTSFPISAHFDIPQDATSAEIWFYNYALTGGSPCQAYDSNNSQNYRFEVLGGPGWMGNVVQNISRGASHPCDGGAPLEESYQYDSWARTRASVRNVCFEVWQEGFTDRANPDLWQDLDVQVHWRYGDGPFTSQYLDLVDQPNNNARYAFNVGAVDPFAYYTCPEQEIPVEIISGSYGQEIATTTLQFYFTVNGFALRPGTGSPFFAGNYQSDTPTWQSQNCP